MIDPLESAAKTLAKGYERFEASGITHECIRHLATKKIDHCSGKAYNRCYGYGPMMLELWHPGKDGCESYCDEWVGAEVNFCPYCGLASTATRKR